MTKTNKSTTKPAIANPLNDMLGYHLRRASNAMLVELCHDYSTLGLSLTEATILILINANPGLKQSEIGRALDIKSGNMTPLIASLNKQSLIDRKPLDGRSVGIYLSKDGQPIVTQVLNFVSKNERWLSAEMSTLEQDQMKRCLSNIWS